MSSIIDPEEVAVERSKLHGQYVPDEVKFRRPIAAAAQTAPECQPDPAPEKSRDDPWPGMGTAHNISGGYPLNGNWQTPREAADRGLRHACLKRAIRSHSGNDYDEIVKAAQAYYDFLTGKGA